VGDADRVMAAELRHIDVGVGGESFAVANIAEPPDRTSILVFDVGAAGDRLAFCVEPDRGDTSQPNQAPLRTNSPKSRFDPSSVSGAVTNNATA
jgi:hypothetical protein